MTAPPGTELARPWYKSSRSTGGQDCVEVAQTQASCLVRDSKDPGGARLAISRQDWTAFTRRIKNGTTGV
jgi:hypothetical protein